MNRREIVVALVALGTLRQPQVAFAQHRPATISRIGILSPEPASGLRSQLGAFQAGLLDLGYEEGKNLVIEFRSAEGRYDRLPELAADLVRLKVDVLVTYGAVGSRAAKTATTTIPIVLAAVGDPVAQGLVTNLARPGGNITGLTIFSPELMAKRLELLKDVLPQIRRVAVLLNSAHPIGSKPILQAMSPTAELLKLDLQPLNVGSPSEFDTAFEAMRRQRAEAVVVVEDSLFVANAGAVANLASMQRIPSIGSIPLAEAGCLIGYGVNSLAIYRRAAVFVDKILKGANPGELSIERATTFDVVVNIKTAKALGVSIPRAFLLRAERVIE